MRKAAVLLLLSFLCIPTLVASANKTIEVGERVPDFSLPGIDGAQISMDKNIRGKAPLTLLFFMTTACSTCFDELKEIDEFIAKNPGKIDVWCVAVDLRGAQTVAPFQQANRFKVKYLIDPKFTLPRAFGFSYTPSLAVLDAKGLLMHKKGGYSPNERLSDLISTFLK